MQISKTSLLYRLAKFGGLQPHRSLWDTQFSNRKTDTCDLLLHALWGLVRIPVIYTGWAILGCIALAFAVGSLMTVIGMPIIELYCWIAYGYPPEMFVYILGATFVGILIVYLFAVAIGDAKAPKPIASLGSLYHAWKTKTCVTVEII